ncbi:hypothetical protein IEO21_03264 [Rhodonia placenta]|uniref:Uncharacterized protein n=1 Tax=Rhodonia placenta TaxID=104341 RepID=A0A8H7P601_9APHY|nr:hypothetical protein IEO21_03264 [Postia placenta]
MSPCRIAAQAPAGAQEMLHCVVTRSEGLGWKGFYCAALTSRDTRRLSPEHAMRTQGSGHWVWVLLLYVVTRRGDLGLQGVELCGTGAARHTTPKPRLHWHALGRLWPLGFGTYAPFALPHAAETWVLKGSTRRYYTLCDFQPPSGPQKTAMLQVSQKAGQLPTPRSSITDCTYQPPGLVNRSRWTATTEVSQLPAIKINNSVTPIKRVKVPDIILLASKDEDVLCGASVVAMVCCRGGREEIARWALDQLKCCSAWEYIRGSVCSSRPKQVLSTSPGYNSNPEHSFHLATLDHTRLDSDDLHTFARTLPGMENMEASDDPDNLWIAYVYTGVMNIFMRKGYALGPKFHAYSFKLDSGSRVILLTTRNAQVEGADEELEMDEGDKQIGALLKEYDIITGFQAVRWGRLLEQEAEPWGM